MDFDAKSIKKLKELGPELEEHASIWAEHLYKMMLDGKIPVYANIDLEQLTSVLAGYWRRCQVRPRGSTVRGARHVECRRG